MEDLKKIQEFFSKPVKENSRRSPDFILTDPAEIKYTESFGSGIKAPGVLHHANEGVFLGAEGAYIIVLPGGTFYVDEDKEEAIPIYPLKDQSRELQLALDYTPFSPKFETWKSWIKRPKTLEEQADHVSPNEGKAYKTVTDKDGNTFKPNKKYKTQYGIAKFIKFSPDNKTMHLKSDEKGLIKTSVDNAKNMELLDQVNENKPVAAEASKGAMNYFSDLKYEYQKAFRYLDVEEREEYKQLVKDFFSRLQIDNKVRAVGLDEYNTGIYYKDEKTQDKAKEASKSALGKVKDFIKKVIKEEEITVDDATEFKLNLKHLLDKHVVKEEEGYSQFLKTDDNPEGKTKGLDTATMNKILMNVIKDLDELKQLGEGVIEEELCAKGKAYIKKRQAAGEKSSAYLSGRAVKVCKGQMKG